MKVIISGLTASGKSTLAVGLSYALGLEYFSASSKLKEILPPKDFQFWESKKGIDIVKFRLKHLKYDKLLDDYILRYVKTHDDIILDSWVASWKIEDKNSIKIYLKADLKTRAERVAKRDGINFEEAMRFMKEKDRLTSQVYYKLYGIEIQKDMVPFDLVINSGTLSVDQLKQLCLTYILSLKSSR